MASVTSSDSLTTPQTSNPVSGKTIITSPPHLHPITEPFQSGWLAVGDGHEIYYEVSGKKDGLPALFLHGGPGAGTAPWIRGFFNPDKYCIVLLDQRGCGKSRPNASVDWKAALHENNTATLVEDCERVRKHVGVTQWHMIQGGSWGSTLALKYAQDHPGVTRALTLRGTFLMTPPEIDYLFQDGRMEAHCPDAWADYKSHITESSEHPEMEASELLQAYYRRLTAEEEEVRLAAARSFIRFELRISKANVDQNKIRTVLGEPSLLVPFALFEVVFMLNHGWLKAGELVEGCRKLPADTKVRIVHGRMDFVCRPCNTWRLKQALEVAGVRDVKYVFTKGQGHSNTEPLSTKAIVEYNDELAEE